MVSERLKKARVKARRLRREFRNHIVTAIAAAIGFLIAFVWREPIIALSNIIIIKMGIVGEAVLFKFITALIITIILAILLMVVARWEVKEE